MHVEWDPQAPVTPIGQLVFFWQFLAAGGLFAADPFVTGDHPCGAWDRDR